MEFFKMVISLSTTPIKAFEIIVLKTPGLTISTNWTNYIRKCSTQFLSMITIFLHPTQNRGRGVTAILRSDSPGYSTDNHLTERSIRNCYLVFRLLIYDALVYIHNIHALVKAE